MGRRKASRTTSSQSSNSATFHLTGWRLLHPTEPPGDLPMPLECHILTVNTIVLQLSHAVTKISMPQCPTHSHIPLTSAHFVADNATHALASTATVKTTLNDEEERIVIRNAQTLEKDRRAHKYNPGHSRHVLHVGHTTIETCTPSGHQASDTIAHHHSHSPPCASQPASQGLTDTDSAGSTRGK